MPKKPAEPVTLILEYLGPHDAVDVLTYVAVQAGSTIDVPTEVATGLLENPESWALRDAHTNPHGVTADTTEES